MIRRTLWALPVALTVLTGCGNDPVTTELPEVEIVVASGDGQFGPLGGQLPDPLKAVVRTAAAGSPVKDVSVVWTVVQGEASFVTSEATVTDSAGVADVRVSIGAGAGEVHIRATVAAQESAGVDFVAYAVDRPVLTSLSAGAGDAGSTVVLQGSGFSSIPDQNVVLFSGIRAQVTGASGSELTVRVPPCLPSRSVLVSVQLGTLVSAALPFLVEETTEPTVLAVGEVLDVSDDETCVRVSGEDGARYLAIVQSSSTVGVARHDFTFTGVGASPSTHATRSVATHVVPQVAPLDPQTEWHDVVRRLERAAPPGRGAPASPVLRAPAAIPTIGMRRSFQVLNVNRELEEVDAVARYVGAQVALFVDEASPAGGFTVQDLEAFANRFDQVIHPTVTGAFGRVSDLDGDQRVTVLLTPVVNRMTPRGANGFVGGFFYGVDLQPEVTGSNGGEVFYTLVPDPAGTLSDARPVDDLLRVVPAILAHEFQHMVHFNERRIVLGAQTGDATWVSEGLAQVAEELVARHYRAAADEESVELFRFGNRLRARRYLDDPSAVSLVFGVGPGNLEERGAGILQMLYLGAQLGDDVYRDLTRTTRTSVSSIVARAGRGWDDLLADWWSAIYLTGKVPARNLTYPHFDLPDFLGGPGFPLRPDSIPDGDFGRSGSLWSASARYYIVVPSLHGSMAMRLAGESGSSSPSGAALRLRLIRLP